MTNHNYLLEAMNFNHDSSGLEYSSVATYMFWYLITCSCAPWFYHSHPVSSFWKTSIRTTSIHLHLIGSVAPRRAPRLAVRRCRQAHSANWASRTLILRWPHGKESTASSASLSALQAPPLPGLGPAPVRGRGAFAGRLGPG